MVLVNPAEIKALLVYPQRNGRSRTWILKRQQREWNVIYYSCLSHKNYSFSKLFFVPSSSLPFYRTVGTEKATTTMGRK